MTTASKKLLLLCILITSLLILTIVAKKDENKRENDPDSAKEKWKKKDIVDYSDADIERLFEQWEENDDEEPNPDDLNPYDKPKPQLDLSKIDPNNPESMMKLSKKGQPIMMFVSVSGNPTKDETEKISMRWQDQLFNANIQFKRYVVGENRILFHVDDGSLAFDMKDFLIQQERCQEVSIDHQVFYGKGSGKNVDNVGHIIGAEEAEEAKKKNSKPKGKKSKKKMNKKVTAPIKEEL